MSLANDLPILFTFSRNQLLVLLILAIVSFGSFLLISPLSFMISFLQLTLGFFLCFFFFFFLVDLGVKIGYLFDFSFVS